MIKIKRSNLSANIQLFLFILALILFYLILKPLINIFLTSIIFAYVFYPFYTRIKNRIKYTSLSIFATLFLIIIIFLIPFLFVASQIPGQVANLNKFVQENVIGKDLLVVNCEGSVGAVCSIINVLSESDVVSLDKVFEALFAKITELVRLVVISVPSFVIGVGFALFIAYFLFKDGRKIVNTFVDVIPLQKKYAQKLVDQFGRVTHSVVFAHLIVAIVQGALGTIAFYVFGIESPIFWGLIMAIFALLPVIGPAIIWLPAGLVLLITGFIGDSYFVIGQGIGLLLFGAFIISTIDNILRVKLVGDSADVHPLTVLIGLIGGVSLFGLAGIFIGPIILSLLVTYIEDFSKRYKE